MTAFLEPLVSRSSPASNLCNLHKLPALANPDFSPSGTCCTRDPFFKTGTRAFTKAAGDASPGEDETGLGDLNCAPGGVIDKLRNPVGEDELMIIGLAAGMLELMSQHRGADRSGEYSVDYWLASVERLAEQGILSTFMFMYDCDRSGRG